LFHLPLFVHKIDKAPLRGTTTLELKYLLGGFSRTIAPSAP